MASKYDAERKALGMKVTSMGTPSLDVAAGTSRYAAEREQLKRPTAPLGTMGEFRKLDEASRVMPIGGVPAPKPEFTPIGGVPPDKPEFVPIGGKPTEKPQFTIGGIAKSLHTARPAASMVDYFKREKKKTPEQKQQDLTEFAKSPAGAFGYSLTDKSPVGLVNKLVGGKDWMGTVKEGQKAHPVISGIGGLAGSALSYGTVGKAVSGSKALEAVKNPFIREMIGQQLADTAIQTPGVIMGGIAEKKPAGEIAKDVGKQQAMDFAGNLLFYGIDKGMKKIGEIVELRKQLKKPVEEIVDSVEAVKIGKIVKPVTKPGTYKVKNVALENAIEEYNDAIELVHNHFKTNELRANEIPLIKSELGIDLEAILDRMEIAEKGVKIPSPDDMRLRRIAGAMSDKAYETLDKVRGIPIGGKAAAEEAATIAQGATKTIPSAPIGGIPATKPEFVPIGGKISEKPLSFPQTVANADITASELKEMIKNNPLSYEPITNTETLKFAQGIVDQNFEAAKRIVKEGQSFANATESAMAQDVIRRLQNNKQWDEAFEVMDAVARKAKTSGQAIQAFAMWRKMTPEGMLKYAKRVFDQTDTHMPVDLAEQITESMKRIEGITDERLLRNVIMGEAREMPQWAYKHIGEKTTEQLQDIAMAQVLSNIADHLPKSAWKKVSTIQAMSHLINIKTAARNILGNLSFGALEKLSNTVATPIDVIASKFTGQRTLTLPQLSGGLKAGVGQAKDAALEASLGIDISGVSSKYNVPRGSSFKGQIGKGAEKLLSYELNVPDEFFKGEIYNDVLQQQMKAAGVTEATQDMIQYARDRARYATFQDDSFPARLLQGIKDLLNFAGGGKEIVGKSGIKTREFGLGDFVVKYTTVPGNLVSRAVEYTPAGLLKILGLAANAKMSGAVKQSEIAMTIGRSIVGTGMITLGALLKRKGLLVSEDRDRSRAAKALDQSEGLGNYQVNMSAVDRLLDGGDATPQAGDKLYSYNWLEPLGVSLAVGAIIENEIQKSGKGWGVLTDLNTLTKAGSAAMEEIIDLPTLSVVKQMVYQDNIFDVLITPIVQGVSGFIPGPIRQYAQVKDPTARLTQGETLLTSAFNRIKAGIPGARESLEPRIGPFGGEITYPGGGFHTMMNPGHYSEYSPSEVTPALKQLEDITGETKHYPRDKAIPDFMFRGEKIELTPEEKTLYMQIEGTEVLNYYKRVLSKGVTEQSAAMQAAALERAKTKAGELAKREILKRRQLIR